MSHTKYAWEIFRNLSNEERFHIKDDILLACLGLGGNGNNRKYITGFSRKKDNGYALLIHFLYKALNFKRFSLCEDRVYAEISKDDSFSLLLKSLGVGGIEKIIEEVQSIYEFTQKKLQEQGIKTVSLKREIQNIILPDGKTGLGYGETLLMLKKSCERLDITTTEINMDTLNSFGDEKEAYKSPIYLELDINSTDIFCCSRLIGDRSSTSTMESGEWLVINKSPNGLVEIPVSSIKYRENLWNEEKYKRCQNLPFELSKEKAEEFLERYRSKQAQAGRDPTNH